MKLESFITLPGEKKQSRARKMVRGEGFEPSRVAPPDPKSGASADSATLASRTILKRPRREKKRLQAFLLSAVRYIENMFASSFPDSADVTVLGGGITGAAVAHLCARVGLKVVLFEKGDFACGTSSKTTKLLHGGLRYLEQGKIRLVREALQERNFFLETLPHLARPLRFLVPFYPRSSRPPWKIRIGLFLYDLFAARFPFPHRILTAKEVQQREPALRREGLKGGALYADVQTDDARLVLETALAAENHGAFLFPRCAVTSAELRKDGTLNVAFLHESGASGTLRTRVLVLAAGPWTTQILDILPIQARAAMRPTRGSHLVLAPVVRSHALLLTSPEDGRAFFLLPWERANLLGTTDIDHKNPPDTVQPTDEEIAYLQNSAQPFFPASMEAFQRLHAAFAGLRPLSTDDPRAPASSISREERLTAEGPFLILTGGKLTTHRAIARKALKHLAQMLRCSFNERKSPSKYPGAFEKENLPHFTKLPDFLQKRFDLSPEESRHLAGRYGARALSLAKLLHENPAWRQPLAQGLLDLEGEVVWACRNEAAYHLDDVLCRRTKIAYSFARAGCAVERAADIMAREKNWNERQKQEEIQRYLQNLFPPVAVRPKNA